MAAGEAPAPASRNPDPTASGGTDPRATVLGILAPAKLNLYLELVGRRSDGFHDLATLFATTAFGDRIVVARREAPGVGCVVTGADLPTDDRNLAVRAASAWLSASGAAGGVSLHLEKRTPIGGGLGGGSSDAAAVLRRLGPGGPSGPGADGGGRGGAPGGRIGGPTPRAVDLEALARALGADVPFLLVGGVAEAFGRGDDVRPLPAAPPVAIVLLIAPFGTDAATVYARSAERLRPAPARGLQAAKAALGSGEPARIREAHHNDLAQPAMRAYPELLRFTSLAERLLHRAPCFSGSGSTLFDVPDPGETDDVVARLHALPGRRVVTRLAGLPPVGA